MVYDRGLDLGANLNDIQHAQNMQIYYFYVLSKWEVKRCQCCGSSGTHLACSTLQSLEQNWECLDCRRITYNSGNSL